MLSYTLWFLRQGYNACLGYINIPDIWSITGKFSQSSGLRCQIMLRHNGFLLLVHGTIPGRYTTNSFCRWIFPYLIYAPRSLQMRLYAISTVHASKHPISHIHSCFGIPINHPERLAFLTLFSYLAGVSPAMDAPYPRNFIHGKQQLPPFFLLMDLFFLH